MNYFEHSYYLGVLMIIIGLIIRYLSGESPNLLGYRTPNSCKNNKSWVMANKYAGKLSIICGCIYTIVFYFMDRFFTLKNEIGISLIVFIAIFVFIVIFTEIKLSKYLKNR